MTTRQVTPLCLCQLVTGACRRDHITPVLRQLHWPPVRQRTDFTLTVLVYKSLHGFSLICQTTDNWSDVNISGHRTSRRVPCRGHRHRLVTTPWLWNNLPIEKH